MKNKKSLGQNFLKSQTVADLMIHAGNPQEDDVVLEIGPGEGVMTELLLKLAGKVIAVEKDERLIPVLNKKFKKEIEEGKLDIIEGDILEFDTKFFEKNKKPYKIIANIPYYITGQILRKFLSAEEKPKSITLLVQKEVAERITAKNGKESILSLAVKIFGEPKYVKTVNRSAFKPQPNVDSAIIHIENIDKEKISGKERDFFFKVVHAGFAHKRKQLLSNLSLIFPKDLVLKSFEKNGLDSKIRAEDLSLQTWINFCKELNDA